MRTIELQQNIRQVIGAVGERETVQVNIRVNGWRTVYPAGVGGILVTPPGPLPIATPVPLTVTVDTSTNIMSAVVPDELLARPGEYIYQATWNQGGVQVVSREYYCIVMSSSLMNDKWTPHQQGPAWAEIVMSAAELVENAMPGVLQAELNTENAMLEATAQASTATNRAGDAARSAEAAAGSAAAALASEQAAATHNYGISVSGNTLVITPPVEEET